METVPRILCCHCGALFVPGKRNKEQRFCGEEACRKARKAAWQKRKMKTDPAYRANQKQAWQVWAADHPGYWKDYRAAHPEKARRNRLLQNLRNRKRRNPGSVIAKMDAFRSRPVFASGPFWMVPVIAKMDAFKVNLYGFSEPYP